MAYSIIFFIYGLVFGSFVNVIIDRFPYEESVFKGRSRCDGCRRTLRWFELIPLFSFLLQGGKCRRCGIRLSWQYPLMEIVTGCLFVYAYMMGSGEIIPTGMYILLFCTLLVNFMIDLKHQMLLDMMTLIAGCAVIILHLTELQTMSLWLPYILSSLCASAFFLLLWAVTRGKGMGFGDVELVLVLGLWLGFPHILYALYIAFLTGAVWGVILIIARIKKLRSHVAFGPFLIAGSILSMQFGTTISSWLKGILW